MYIDNLLTKLLAAPLFQRHAENLVKDVLELP